MRNEHGKHDFESLRNMLNQSQELINELSVTENNKQVNHAILREVLKLHSIILENSKLFAVRDEEIINHVRKSLELARKRLDELYLEG